MRSGSRHIVNVGEEYGDPRGLEQRGRFAGGIADGKPDIVHAPGGVDEGGGGLVGAFRVDGAVAVKVPAIGNGRGIGPGHRGLKLGEEGGHAGCHVDGETRIRGG